MADGDGPETEPTSSSHPAPPRHPPMPADVDTGPGRSQVVDSSSFRMSPLMFPGVVPIQIPEENNHGAGIYAIPYVPYMGVPMAGFPPSTLIPLKYKIPTGQTSGGATEEQGQGIRQQHGPQRQVVVRQFHLAFQLDLALILKLAAMVFLLSQDGSKQRLVLLVFFASLVYLYQTGALAPFLQWLQRVGATPQQPPRQPQNNFGNNDRNNPQPGDDSGVQNQNQPADNHDQQAANENQPEPGRHGINWWAVVKEIQMFVIGFITSLLPGFHNND